MEHVVATTKVLLKHDLYYDESDDDKKVDSDTETDMSNDNPLSDKSDNEEDGLSSHKRKTKSTKKTCIKR